MYFMGNDMPSTLSSILRERTSDVGFYFQALPFCCEGVRSLESHAYQGFSVSGRDYIINSNFITAFIIR